MARIVQYSPKISTKSCIWTKRVHYISSYMIMLVAKFNYLNLRFLDGFDGTFVVLLAIDLFFFAIYLWVKFFYWTASEETIDKQLLGK